MKAPITSVPAVAASAQRRITSLASLTSVHRAFHWLHLHQPQLRQWLLDIVRIPAPSFAEQARAGWFLNTFRSLGLTNVHLDEVGNVLGEISTMDSRNDAPVLLLSAHLDTVFPSGTRTEPVEEVSSSRILAPGVCDNAAGLTGLLGIAAAIRYAGITPPTPILFAANVGEEGEGDLRGMRHLFHDGLYSCRIAAAIALEGSGSSTVVTRGLGSLRLRVTISGPGGHSWTDAGIPNPIFLLSRALADLSALSLPSEPRTTLSAGCISGGTSVNSIPESATVLLDVRSTDPVQIQLTALAIESTFTSLIVTSNLGTPTQTPAKLSVQIIGNRPAGALSDDSFLLHTVRAVDRHLAIRTEPRIGSTDANIPLSQDIPAIALGGGGVGGSIHTLSEWYDPSGREIALRRVLLIVLDSAQQIGRTKSG
jgi:tripeptide aminopeptidase